MVSTFEGARAPVVRFGAKVEESQDREPDGETTTPLTLPGAERRRLNLSVCRA